MIREYECTKKWTQIRSEKIHTTAKFREISKISFLPKFSFLSENHKNIYQDEFPDFYEITLKNDNLGIKMKFSRNSANS